MSRFYYKQNRLKQLRAFCYAAQFKSMSKAAEQMFLSQPSISLLIQLVRITHCIRSLRVSFYLMRGNIYSDFFLKLFFNKLVLILIINDVKFLFLLNLLFIFRNFYFNFSIFIHIISNISYRFRIFTLNF